jgi:serine/threonine protein kinase
VTLFKYCRGSGSGSREERAKKERLLAARNCCTAVAELHALNIVHGDLASENIMILERLNQVKLIDFDMASEEGTTHSAGGNPDFISKEMTEKIAKGKKVKSDKSDDLYSLAICCFMLVGDND